MDTALVVGLLSSFFGGFSVAMITYLSGRRKSHAEVRRIEAETDRIKAETSRLLSEMNTQEPMSSLHSTSPSGWYAAGSHPADYQMGIDRNERHSGSQSGFIECVRASSGFGTLMQSFSADNYRGARLSLSAYLKTQDTEHAALWMRIDRDHDRTISIDNMDDRPIQGDTNWTRHQIVLDVPDEASAIAFGVLLAGSGRVWIDDVSFETVDDSIPTTEVNERPLLTPVNLDFQSS